ncbi:MAG: hypothetical protein ACE5K0_08230, partial [Candidatus Methanofastidiosia archaeon]
MESLAVYDGKLYAGTFEPWPEGGHVYRYEIGTGCEALIETQKEDLADRFSPYMYFYKDALIQEKFRPTKIEDMLNNSGLWTLEIHPQPPPDRTQLHGKPVTPDYISQFQNEQSVYYYL